MVFKVSNDSHTRHPKHGWEIKKIGEVATILNGYAFDSKLFSEDSNDVPLIRIRDIKRGYTETFYKGDFSEEYIIRKGDYLIGMDGEFNIAEWKGENALLNQRVCKIIANKIVDRYLFWYMPIVLKQIEDATPFVTVKHLSSKQLINTTIPIPPREEQERIVRELDCLSGVIERKREQLKQLDALAQSIFYDMFGDPINSKYETKKLADLSEHKLSYGSGASAVDFNGKIRYVRITDIKDDGELHDEKVSPSIIDDKYILKDGDILFARSGATVGKTYLYRSKEGKSIYAGYLIRFIPNRNIVLPAYIYAYTKTSYYKAFISVSAQAVAQPNINAQQYSSLIVPIPPLSLQEQFAEKIEAIEKQKELLKRSIKEVETLFDARMDYYFGDT